MPHFYGNISACLSGKTQQLKTQQLKTQQLKT
jgi:hypothetical protein